jgi:hypothetical protein
MEMSLAYSIPRSCNAAVPVAKSQCTKAITFLPRSSASDVLTYSKL